MSEPTTAAAPPQFEMPSTPITADHPQVQAFAQMEPLSESLVKAAEQLIDWAISFSTLARDLATTVQAAKAVIEAAEQPTRQ